jgi:transcriptional regulator with XRE-family HTH domain
MQPEKRKALEAAGWKFGDAADFLAMTNEERQMLDLRVDAAMAIRRQREAMKLSQQELARRIHTSQPRIVKIEKAAKDVTLDQMLRAYAAAGGRIALKEVASAPARSRARHAKKSIGRNQTKRVSIRSKVLIELVGNEG